MKNHHNYSSTLSALCLLSLAALPAAFASPQDEFNRLDANRDGFVDQTEQVIGTAQQFVALDTNQDGYLTRDEASAAQDTMGRDDNRPGVVSADAVARRDNNDDGRVSAAEQFRLNGEVFARMDTNHDGRLSEREYTARP